MTRVQTVTEGSDAWFVARLVLPEGTIVAQDAIPTDASALVVSVYDSSKRLAGGVSAGQIKTITIDKATIVSDSIVLPTTASDGLTNDGWWNGTDDEGYNFKYRMEYDTDFLGGRRLVVEFALKTTNYGNICWAQPIYISPKLT